MVFIFYTKMQKASMFVLSNYGTDFKLLYTAQHV